MTITIEPKEIAELVGLLARRDSANEIMQAVEDNLPELTDKVMGHFAEQLSRYSPPSIKERFKCFSGTWLK